MLAICTDLVIEHTFGFHRAEVIAALVSVLTIWILTGFLVHEAIQRIRHPQVINAKLVRETTRTCYELDILIAYILDVYDSSYWCCS